MRTPKQTEAISERLAISLAKLEQNWSRSVIQIGYECDTDTGRIVIRFEPVGDPANILTVSADVADVRAGDGPSN